MKLKHIVLIAAFAALTNIEAATINAASASKADVESAIASANPGDTVVVPSGTVSWSTSVAISGITLQGPGKDAGSPTTITAGYVNITKHATHNTHLKGFRFSGNSQHFDINGAVANEMFIVSDCYFYNDGAAMGTIGTNGGLIYDCEFEKADNVTGGSPVQATLGNTAAANAEWAAAHTMGDADTNGDANVYIEDCTITNIRDGFPDVDDGAKVVMRYNTFNDASVVTHGGGNGGSENDTSTYGARHLEVYNNTFNRVATTEPLNQWLWMRGATGVFANNTVDDPSTGSYPGKPDIRLTVGCDTGSYPRQYQVGQSTQATDSTPDEPLLIFGNTWTGHTESITLGENPLDSCSAPGDFIQDNRDYDRSNSWSWTPYTYPHPLRAAAGSSYTGQLRLNSTGSRPSLSGGAPFKLD